MAAVDVIADLGQAEAITGDETATAAEEPEAREPV